MATSQRSITRWCEWCASLFEPQGQNQRFCSVGCREVRKPPLVHRVCLRCSRPYAASNRRQKYCSLRCAQPPVGEHVCRGCGVVFGPTRRDRTSYCTRECIFRHKAAPRRCPACGREFTPHWTERTTYCSAACAGVGQPGVDRVCAECRLPFKGRATRVYCSDECRRTVARRKARAYNASHHVEVERQCRECSGAFTPSYGDKHRDFCSPVCGRKQSRRIGKAKASEARQRRT